MARREKNLIPAKMIWGQGYLGYKDANCGYDGQAVYVYRKKGEALICQGGRPKDGGIRKEVCVYLMGLD